MATQESPPTVPTGNLRIISRMRRLLRRDYFYTESTRPTDGNPLLLNLTGYLALSVLLSVLLGYYFRAMHTDVFVLAALVEVLITLLPLVLGLHLFLWTAGTLWRILRGHASLRA